MASARCGTCGISGGLGLIRAPGLISLHRQPELLTLFRRQFAEDAALFGVLDQLISGLPHALDDRPLESISAACVGRAHALGVQGDMV